MKYKIKLKNLEGPLAGAEYTVYFEPEIYPMLPHGNAPMIITDIQEVGE